MTFLQLYTEVNRIRFNNSTAAIAAAKNYVNAAELEFWNSANWIFKRVQATNLTVTAGQATEPTDFGKAIRLYDPRGDEVPWVNPDDFEAAYVAPVPVPTGNAEAYTVINRQIIVGPGETGTFKLAYRRRYAHFNAGLTIIAGVMSVDTDLPLWDSEFHYALVPLAIVCGARLEGDVAPQLYQEQADRLLGVAQDELVRGAEQLVEVWGDGSW